MDVRPSRKFRQPWWSYSHSSSSSSTASTTTIAYKFFSSKWCSFHPAEGFPAGSPSRGGPKPNPDAPVLQTYTNIKQLGSGATCKAYLAKGNSDNVIYVIKSAPCIGSKYNQGVASYVLQECRILAQLKHGNIVELIVSL